MSNTVEVVVSEGQKDTWKIFVEEESEKYDTLSDLVRTAVEEQIARELGEQDIPDDVQETMRDTQQQLHDLQTKIEDARETVETVEDHQINEAAVDDIMKHYTKQIRADLEVLEDSSEDESNE